MIDVATCARCGLAFVAGSLAHSPEPLCGACGWPCRWCGKPYPHHVAERPAGAPQPRMPCLGLKSGFLPRRLDAPPSTPEHEEFERHPLRRAMNAHVAMKMYGRELLRHREECGVWEPWEHCTCCPSGNPAWHDHPCPRDVADDAASHFEAIGHRSEWRGDTYRETEDAS